MASFFAISSLFCLSGVNAHVFNLQHGNQAGASSHSAGANFLQGLIGIGNGDMRPLLAYRTSPVNSRCGNCVCCLPYGTPNRPVCPPGCAQQCNCGGYVIPAYGTSGNGQTATPVTQNVPSNTYSTAPSGGIPSAQPGNSGITGPAGTGSQGTGSSNPGNSETPAPGGNGNSATGGATGTGTETGSQGSSGKGNNGQGNGGCNCNQYPLAPTPTTTPTPCICNQETSTTPTTTTTTTKKPCVNPQTTTTTTTTTTAPTPAPCAESCKCTSTCTTTCPPQKPCPECKCPACPPAPTSVPGAYPVAPVFPGAEIAQPGLQAPGSIFGTGGVVSTGTGITGNAVVSGTGLSGQGTGSACCIVSLTGTNALLSCGCNVQGIATLDSCYALSKAGQCKAVTNFPVNNVNAYITNGKILSCESAVAAGYIQWAQITAQCSAGSGTATGTAPGTATGTGVGTGTGTITGTGNGETATGETINIPTNGDQYTLPTSTPPAVPVPGKDAYPQPVTDAVAAVSGISALALAALAVYIVV